LAVALALAGCLVPWETPTPAVAASATPVAQLRRATATPNARPTPAAEPTEVPRLTQLAFSDEALQFWSNPNDVSRVLYDGQAVWAATYGGAVRWDASGTPQVYGIDEGLLSQSLRGLAQDGDGHIWVGYTDRAGWSEFDGQVWTSYETREAAVEARYGAMLAARRFDPRLWSKRPDGTWLWLPTANGQVSAYDGTRWRTYGAASGVTDGTWMVAVSANGRVWAVGRGLSTAEEGEVRWTDHNFFSAVAEDAVVTDVAADADSVWLTFANPTAQEGQTADNGGIGRFEAGESRWEGYLHEWNADLPGQAHAIEIDADGTVWVAGTGGITYRAPGQPWKQIAFEGSAAQCFARGAAGEIWLGTERGVWWLAADGSARLGPWQIPSPLPGSEVTGLALGEDGRVWIGTSDGLAYVDAGGETEMATSTRVLALAAAPSGEIWLSAADGLYRLTASGVPELRADQPLALLAFDAADTLYGCTAAGGLVRLAGNTLEPVADLLALAGAAPKDLAVDGQGQIWFATELGLGHLLPDGTFELIGEGEGDALLSVDVRSVAPAPDGSLWVATARGLARYQPGERWVRYTTESTGGGLASMDVRAVRVDEAGIVWVITAAGLSQRTPESADWYTFDLAAARSLLPDRAAGVVWIGSQGGLYRVRIAAYTPIP
jgi:ligand-binding sensor domain-containing protein